MVVDDGRVRLIEVSGRGLDWDWCCEMVGLRICICRGGGWLGQRKKLPYYNIGI